MYSATSALKHSPASQHVHLFFLLSECGRKNDVDDTKTAITKHAYITVSSLLYEDNTPMK